MSASKSPFTPGFGSSPPLLAGRENLIETFIDGLEDGPGSSARFSMYYGPRGIGKTALLNAIEIASKEQGWLVISETCTQGIISRLTQNRLPAVYEQSPAPAASKRRLTNVSIPAVAGLSWENAQARNMDLREWIEKITDTLERYDTGLLITLDEVHPNTLNEITELVSVIQHAFREKRNLAFAGAALSTSKDGLLEGDTTTFLRRAEWHELSRVSIVEAEKAITEPIFNNGRKISKSVVRKAAEYTQGHGYMIQLIGDLMWKKNPEKEAITEADFIASIPGVKRRLGASVIAPELAHLTDVHRSYLLAMAEEIRDNGVAKTSAITSKMGVSIKYSSVYRERLIQRGLIVATGHGLVDFVTPGMGEYILEHGN